MLLSTSPKTTPVKKKDEEDETTGAETGKTPPTSTATTLTDEKARAAAENVVGKNGKDAKTEKEKKAAIASNLQQQAGTVRRLGAFQSGNNDDSTWVDADTTTNELNNESTLHVRTITNSLLSVYDQYDRDGNLLKCVSLAR